MKNATISIVMLFTAFVLPEITFASEQDGAIVAALDKQYQAAVKANDYATMDTIMADNFIFLNGGGKVGNRDDFIGLAKKSTFKFEHQEEIDNSQKVYVWGDTAVVTAQLWIKGTYEGHASDDKVWFSDVYVRTKSGWKYVCGQVLPNEH